MQRPGTKLNEEQVSHLCDDGSLYNVPAGQLYETNALFSPYYFFTLEDGAVLRVSKRLGEQIDSLIVEYFDRIKGNAIIKLQREIETLFRYKALSIDDKVLILKELHLREWTDLEERFKQNNSKIDYLWDDDYFKQRFRSIITPKLSELFYWIFYEEPLETIFGDVKYDWFELVWDDSIPEIRTIIALAKIEYLKEQILIISNPAADSNGDSEDNNSTTPLKQQILLLEELGVFDLPIIQNLSEIQKGKLFGLMEPPIKLTTPRRSKLTTSFTGEEVKFMRTDFVDGFDFLSC